VSYLKLTVLVDNNTFIDKYYFGEPAVSYYIEDGDKRILFDAGYSDLFIRNAQALGIDLSKVTDIVISHGHDDHTGGLKYFFEQFSVPRIKITAHPKVLDIGLYSKYADLALTEKPVKISDNIWFLGEIPSLNDFEERKPIDGDYLFDDSAIAYTGEKGIYIITGCSHSGICNIIAYGKQVCGDHRVAGVIGGFHLFDIDSRVQRTIDYFTESDISELYPCHCVSLGVKAEINRHIPILEAGVSLELEVK